MRIIANTLITIISTGDDPAGDHLPPRRFVEGIGGFLLVEVTRDELLAWGGCDIGRSSLDEYINANPGLVDNCLEAIDYISSWEIDGPVAGNESAALLDLVPTRTNMSLLALTIMWVGGLSAIHPLSGIAFLAVAALGVLWYMSEFQASYQIKLVPGHYQVKELDPAR